MPLLYLFLMISRLCVLVDSILDLEQYPQLGYNPTMINTVIITNRAQKQIRKVPLHVAQKFAGWVISVEEKGIEEVRKIPGYHDEPLTGTRKGQRSIRLTISYRAIYRIEKDDQTKSEVIEFVSVEEVTKHKY
jgi:proteic killer suppression protein